MRQGRQREMGTSSSSWMQLPSTVMLFRSRSRAECWPGTARETSSSVHLLLYSGEDLRIRLCPQRRRSVSWSYWQTRQKILAIGK